MSTGHISRPLPEASRSVPGDLGGPGAPLLPPHWVCPLVSPAPCPPHTGTGCSSPSSAPFLLSLQARTPWKVSSAKDSSWCWAGWTSVPRGVTDPITTLHPDPCFCASTAQSGWWPLRQHLRTKAGRKEWAQGTWRTRVEQKEALSTCWRCLSWVWTAAATPPHLAVHRGSYLTPRGGGPLQPAVLRAPTQDTALLRLRLGGAGAQAVRQALRRSGGASAQHRALPHASPAGLGTLEMGGKMPAC